MEATGHNCPHHIESVSCRRQRAIHPCCVVPQLRHFSVVFTCAVPRRGPGRDHHGQHCSESLHQTDPCPEIRHSYCQVQARPHGLRADRLGCATAVIRQSRFWYNTVREWGWLCLQVPGRPRRSCCRFWARSTLKGLEKLSMQQKHLDRWGETSEKVLIIPSVIFFNVYNIDRRKKYMNFRLRENSVCVLLATQGERNRQRKQIQHD